MELQEGPERPITANELRPFFVPDGVIHLDLALQRYHNAVLVQATMQKDQRIAELEAAVAASEGLPEVGGVDGVYRGGDPVAVLDVADDDLPVTAVEPGFPPDIHPDDILQ